MCASCAPMYKSLHASVHTVELVFECGGLSAYVFVGMRMSVHMGVGHEYRCVCAGGQGTCHCLQTEEQKPSWPCLQVLLCPEHLLGPPSPGASRACWAWAAPPSDMPHPSWSAASFLRTHLEVVLLFHAPEMMVETINWKRQLIPKGKHSRYDITTFLTNGTLP